MPRRPLVMGIVNVTPDSFSDGGRFATIDLAVDHALRLVDDGADLLDIGGESTRPGSVAVDARTERDRVVPVIERLAKQVSVPISIDTSKASVASAAHDAGAEIINDVTGLESDREMMSLAARTTMGVCAMHMRGTPQTMQDDPTYEDVVTEILHYLIQRDEALVAGGIRPEAICLDPGIGFGKTHQHNFQLIAATSTFAALGRPLLIGHSRKGFIGKMVRDRYGVKTVRPDQLTAATLGVSLALAVAGANVLRVHDVRETVEALMLFEACGGIDAQSPNINSPSPLLGERGSGGEGMSTTLATEVRRPVDPSPPNPLSPKRGEGET